ncbi:MAG: UbiA prenyltransferase family protein [Prevotella sp.]|jgi:4-hydroxybenzoate polyprenyltransferase|nr:UbiA prenyltransferase family protein [Prevotella sp.]
MPHLLNIIKLLRVNQWIKNFLIFAPLFFAFRLPETETVVELLYAFLGFCFLASAVYIINDWCDIEADKLHPRKKHRPLASGAIGKKEAAAILACLFTAGIAIYVFLIGLPYATILLLAYFAMNLSYSLKLKQYAILDVSIVAIGFIIRLFIGGIVSGAFLSYWIIILTFLFAMLLVLGKRRHDITIFEETGQKMRKSILGYNAEFLNAIIVVVVAVLCICYILYTISPEVVSKNGENLYLTSLFVILGLFRYLQVLYVEKKGDSPTVLIMKDRFLQAVLFFWIASFVAISVLHRM